MDGENPDKRKGGRPKKTSLNRKSKTVGVCFSEPEFYTVKYRAEEAGLPVGVYCREAILNSKIVQSMKKEDVEVLKGLANMGNNLNQFVKISRFTGLVHLETEAMKLFNEIKTIVEKLSDDWRNNKRQKL